MPKVRAPRKPTAERTKRFLHQVQATHPISHQKALQRASTESHGTTAIQFLTRRVYFLLSFPFHSFFLPTIHTTTMPCLPASATYNRLSCLFLASKQVRRRWDEHTISSMRRKSMDHVTCTHWGAPGEWETHRNHVMQITMGLRCEEAVRMNADPSGPRPLTSCAAPVRQVSFSGMWCEVLQAAPITACKLLFYLATVDHPISV